MFYQNFRYFLRKKPVLDSKETEEIVQIRIYTLDGGGR